MQLIIIAAMIIQIIAAIFAINYYLKNLPYIALSFITFALIILLIQNINITQLSPLTDMMMFIISILMLISIVFTLKITSQFNQKDKQLKSLEDIDRAMLSSLSHKGVMNAIVNKLNTALDVDATAVLTFTRNNSKKLNIFATNNLSAKIQESIQSKSNGFISSVIDNRKPLVITKIDDDEEEGFLKTLRTEGFLSYMAMSIIKNGMPIGALTLYSEKPRRYTRKEIEFINAITSQIGIALDRAQLIERIQETSFESVRALVEAIELRDPYTRGHSIQVSELSVKIAQDMEFTERELKLIKFAGLLHDVGKIAIPEAILQKTDPLTQEERTIIQKHPEHSAKIVEPIRDLRSIQNWILHHHERWDGKGYPARREGKETPLQSRILAVCDTYSAMIGERPYRASFTDEQAKREIKSVSGTQLDPKIVDIFLNSNANEVSVSKNIRRET
ncbi:MAG: HD domain-containing protein [Candidatus Stahlbacteria bacterium]|nr:MAG: HD domain-containing protein [Candidatus Stahlbacteria bacterium]